MTTEIRQYHDPELVMGRVYPWVRLGWVGLGWVEILKLLMGWVHEVIWWAGLGWV